MNDRLTEILVRLNETLTRKIDTTSQEYQEGISDTSTLIASRVRALEEMSRETTV